MRQITTDPSEEITSEWSRDARWIYFASNRSGAYQIWKVPPEGGKALQITREGGVTAREGADGYVYYGDWHDPQIKGIWRVSPSGGQETLVVEREIALFFDLTDRGIYFIDLDAKPTANICFYEFATKRITILAPVHKDPQFGVGDGVTVSPDGKCLAYDGGIVTSDIMMIDNFR